MEKKRGLYRVSVGKREERRPLGRPGRIISKLNLRSGVGGDMDRIDLAQDRDRWRSLVNAVINLLFS
jgi:hypothetical protein